MPTSQMPKMSTSSTDQPIPLDEIAYQNRRLQNLVFDEVIRAFSVETKEGRISRAILAKRINKKPEQITRWLSSPSNCTLDTVSTILVGMKAELEPRVIFFRDAVKPNYAHPVIDFLMNEDGATRLTVPLTFDGDDNKVVSPPQTSVTRKPSEQLIQL